MGLYSIQIGFDLLVKVEVLVLLGEVKRRVYISVLLYSNKLELIKKVLSVFEY